MKHTPNSIARERIENYYQNLRSLSNRAQYDKAYALASKLSKQYPHVVEFEYVKAVMTAEDETGYTPAEIKKRHKRTVAMLKPLLKKLRSVKAELRAKIRNEYYWFSEEPYKQYLLGKEEVARGVKRAYYSQGVGAIQLAKKYGLQGRPALCFKWAKISENAWLQFFKVDPNWFNSYFFYAMALGYQGRIEEMDKALARACKISGKTRNWKATRGLRIEIFAVLEAIKTA